MSSTTANFASNSLHHSRLNIPSAHGARVRLGYVEAMYEEHVFVYNFIVISFICFRFWEFWRFGD